MAATRAKFTGTTRSALQVSLVILALGALFVPPLAVAFSGTAGVHANWTALRIAALYAFTLIFLNIVTGSFRPLFNRIFSAGQVQRVHAATGLAGFSLALAHAVLILNFGLTGYTQGAVFIGPFMLVLLAVTILAALTRRRFRRYWRWVHRLNYLIFAAIFVHSLFLGYELKNALFMKVLFGIYAAVAAAGLVYRLQAWRMELRRAGARVPS